MIASKVWNRRTARDPTAALAAGGIFDGRIVIET
jgi:hypothetical protein